MPITIACPGCSKRYSLSDETAGKTARCKQCGQVFRVPAPAAPPPAAPAGLYDADFPGLSPLDDVLPPPAPPRSPASNRPVPPEPAPRLPAYAPPPREAAPLDVFEEHEVLDEPPPAHREVGSFHDAEEDEADAGPAWEPRNPARRMGGFQGGGLVDRLRSMPLPYMIFFGGSAVLWLFLLAVVVPSMGGQGGGGGNVPAAAAAANVPAGAPPAGQPPVPAGPVNAEQVLAGLPGPSNVNLYPAGGQPPATQKAPIRAEVVAQHESALRALLPFLNEIAAGLRNVRDAQGMEPFSQQMKSMATRVQPLLTRSQGLPRLQPAEEQELARRVSTDVNAVSNGIQAELTRIQAIPGLGAAAIQLSVGVNAITSGLKTALAGNDRSSPTPYIEAVISPSSDILMAYAIDAMTKQVDPGGPPGHQSTFQAQTSTSIHRIWPVADPQAFANRVFQGQGQFTVSGNRITVTSYSPNPAALSAFTSEHQHEIAQRKLASAPDPTIAPGTPPIEAALTRIKSGKNHLMGDGLRQLARVPADAEHLDAVVAAAIEVLQDSEPGKPAREAAKVLGQWRNPQGEKALGDLLLSTTDGFLRGDLIEALVKFDTPEATQALGTFMLETTDGFKSKDVLHSFLKKPSPAVTRFIIQYVEKSDDGFGRAEAIRELGRQKVVEAIPAIVGRIQDNWVEAPDALRAMGPAAEPALIELLSSPEARKRKAACEVLRDIGGSDTLAAMKKLPADPDPFVRREASQTMNAVSARVKSQK